MQAECGWRAFQAEFRKEFDTRVIHLTIFEFPPMRFLNESAPDLS
jgi:hypothetical protein